MILLAISLMSQKSTFSAWVSTSETPDCLEMMTGTSWDIASSGAMPNGSLTLGMTYRSAILKIFSTSAAAQEAGEENFVPDAHGGGHFDGSADHVAAAGHDEFDVVHHLQDFFGGGEEIFRAFLHGDSAQEQDDFFVLVDLVLTRDRSAVGWISMAL
jgi:hypothetical protein